MKLIKSQHRSLLKEGLLSDSLMIKLEGASIENFNPDAAINHWFNIIARRPGGGQSKDNVKESKEVAAQHEAGSQEAGDLEGKVEDEVEMIQDVEAAANDENIEYELVEDADDDSNYQSDYDSEDDNTNDVFNKIAEY